MEKQDLRVVKTKRALASAMLALLERQGFANITVNDLCTEAMVSRSTFYVHFEDKYALLHFCLDTMNRRLFTEGDLTMEERLTEVLERIKADVRVFKNLMVVSVDTDLFEMMLRAFHADVEKYLGERRPGADTLYGPPEVITAFCASGITSAIMLWVKRNMPYSTGEMARYLVQLLPGNTAQQK